MHFQSIVHEMKIKDRTVMLLPYLHLQQVHRSFSTAVMLFAHRGQSSLQASLSLSYVALKLDCHIHHQQLSSV